MTKKSTFNFPVSTLVGSTFRNFIKVTKDQKIDRGYRTRYFLTLLSCLILDPFGKGETYFKQKILQQTKINEPPVFIIGFWRSGTTFLHNLLCQDTNFAFTTTYQSIFPNHCLINSGWLKKLTDWIAPEKRPVDNVKLDMDFPQEEEMGIGNIQQISFYNFLYFPNTTEKFVKEALLFENVNQKDYNCWEESYKLIIKKALINSTGNRFLSKNPPNIFRIPQLLKLFPEAKFIYIYRNPYSVLSSLFTFMSQITNGIGFHKINVNSFEHQLTELFKLGYETYQRDKSLIPTDNLFEIQYEQFKKSPVETIESIYQTFNLPGFPSLKPEFEQYCVSQAQHKSGGHSIPDHLKDFIKANFSEYMKNNGYPIKD